MHGESARWNRRSSTRQCCWPSSSKGLWDPLMSHLFSTQWETVFICSLLKLILQMEEEDLLKILSIRQFNLLSYLLPPWGLHTVVPAPPSWNALLPPTFWFIPRSAPASFLCGSLPFQTGSDSLLFSPPTKLILVTLNIVTDLLYFSDYLSNAGLSHPALTSVITKAIDLAL